MDRKAMAEETRRAVEQGFYVRGDGTRVEIASLVQAACAATTLYRPDQLQGLSRTQAAAPGGPPAIEVTDLPARDLLHQQRVLGDRKDVRPDGLAVPARDPRETMRDVLDLYVERGGVEQIEPSP